MLTISDRNPLEIEMVEGDYGITLPIIIETEDTLSASDRFVLKIFKKINGDPLISKDYSNIQNNTINFELTETESLSLPVGRYFYDLDWYQNDVFMCNLVAHESYVVNEKAGAVNEGN